jgi:hypothetical protein
MTDMANVPDTADTDIRVLAFFPSDHAATVGGKLYVNGGYWTKLNFPSYPQVIPLSLVAVFDVPFREYHEDHVMQIGLEDSDRKPYDFDVQGSFRVGADPELRYGDPTLVPLAATVNVQIERAGDFAFTLKLDKKDVARYPFRAAQIALPVQFEVPPPEPPPAEEGQ